MAEREGFEPSIEFPLYTLSKRAPSTTRPSLRAREVLQSQYSALLVDDRSVALAHFAPAAVQPALFFFFQAAVREFCGELFIHLDAPAGSFIHIHVPVLQHRTAPEHFLQRLVEP